MHPQRTIAFITPYFPPYGGGLERYAYEIAKRLQETHGWRVIIITSGMRGGRDTKEDLDGLVVYRLSYRMKFSNTPFSFSWFGKIEKIFEEENPDIVNVHMPVLGIGDVASCYVGKRPLIVTYHGGSMLKGKILPDLFIWTYEHGPLQSLLRRARLIICSSDFIRLDFLKRYTEKSVTITPGVDVTLFNPDPSKKSKRPTILFVGGLNASERHKGLRTFLDAMVLIKEKVPDVRATVVGEGNMLDFFISYARECGIGDAVDFTGRLYGKALVTKYQEAHVFTLPSSNESFGMVILEAMACRLPVVSTTVGGIPTLVDENRTGFLVPPNNPPALAEKLITVLSNPTLASAFANAGYEKAITHFQWNDRKEQYDRVVNALFMTEMNHPSPHAEHAIDPPDNHLTVVTLTYNSAATIGAAFDSLAQQKNKDFEIVVVDDDSTDDTLAVVEEYKKKSGLAITVIRNGTHTISKGRNIGLRAAHTDLVAFLDSDDRADEYWTEAITDTFKKNPAVALLSGQLLLAALTPTGNAIATNDGTVRALFGKGIILFCTANSAFNMKILKSEKLFDEDFRFAEDLEIASRIQNTHTWLYIPEMKVYQTSRGTLQDYAIQMYRYGIWKLYYGFVAKNYRFIDFVPLIIGLLSILACFAYSSLWPLLALPLFSLLESFFVIVVKGPRTSIALLTFPAWLVKNCAWSLGILVGMMSLTFNEVQRENFIKKQSLHR